MAYDEFLADRIRTSFRQKKIVFEEKKMMGGLCFMVNDKMCVGIMKNELMVRVDPEMYEELLQRKGSRQMDFTGRVLKGFLLVNADEIDLDDDFDYWLNLCLDFNPKAISSKKKRSK